MSGTAFGLAGHPGAARGAVASTYYATEMYDRDDPARTFEERRARCYELAAAALLFGAAPDDATLVHGTIDGHRGFGVIGHAWLWLPDGGAWEPITGDVYASRAAWQAFADAQPVRVYDVHAARRMVVASGTFGPWHEHDYR